MAGVLTRHDDRIRGRGDVARALMPLAELRDRVDRLMQPRVDGAKRLATLALDCQWPDIDVIPAVASLPHVALEFLIEGGAELVGYFAFEARAFVTLVLRQLRPCSGQPSGVMPVFSFSSRYENS